MKFLDPTNDLVFKKIFGNEKKPEILISFLNSCLGFLGDKKIKSVEITNPYQIPDIKELKETILDIKAYISQLLAGANSPKNYSHFTANQFQWNSQELDIYQKINLKISDELRGLEISREEGREEGLEQGRKKRKR